MEERTPFGFPNKQAEVLEIITSIAKDGIDYSEETGMDNVKKLALSIYDSVDKFVDGAEPTAEDVAQITYGINQNLSLRDFVMGLPSDRDMDYVGNWVAYICCSTPKEYAAPIISIFSALLYETESIGAAYEHLELAQSYDPNYSLTQLLKRVYESNWPTSAMTKMREQLHPKVKETIGL